MKITVTQADGKDLSDALINEGVTFQRRFVESVREMDTGSWEVYELEANLPEIKLPPEYAGVDIGARAFRLPSGRLIILDGEGNLERIDTPASR